MAARPRVYRAEGVILRRRNLGEADSILTVFSGNEGKFEAIARGVRKARSRMRGHLEPLTRSRVLVAQGRNLDVFTQAETVDAYRRLREDLDASAEALYCLELVDRFTEEREPLPELYALLLEALSLLEEGNGPAVTRHFELRLLALLGYEPHIDGCVLCGDRLPEEETLLSPSAGGLVCRGCRAETGGGRIVSVPVVKLMRFARRATMAEFVALDARPAVEQELRAAVAELVRYHLDRDPNARRFVEGVSALHPKD
ncbi:MAG: DNA repair protein RecO [Dehalococcoidia bacterium]|nr:DNA repair protein RecO [Dehalococcoidia bacterium]MYD28434.1 DNA repair protein RecO [Dehalococcoidia bacterium]